MNNKNPQNDLPKIFLYSLIFLTIAIFFKLFNQLDADYDLWLHIFMGKQSLLKCQIERFDIYSFTNYGTAVINHEWLSQIILTKVFASGGENGLIILRWSISLLIIFFALKIIFLKTSNTLCRIIILLCFAVVISRGISFRLHMFSYLFLLITLYLIYYFIPQRKITGVVLFSFMLMLWSNLHGAFVLGIFTWFVYLFDEYFLKKFKTISWKELIVLLPVAVTLINPYGIKLWFYIYGELLNPISKEYITEWQRFDFSFREIPFFLVLLASWTAFFVSNRKKIISETTMLVVACIMGFSSIRHTPLFVIMALPAIALHMEGALLRAMNSSQGKKNLSGFATVAVSVLLIFSSIIFFYLGMNNGWKLQTKKDPLPFKTTAYIKENKLAGNLWVPLHWGGYALFHLYPEIKVSIDGRWAMTYSQKVMRDNMDFAYHGRSGKWKHILNKYSAHYALVEPSNPALPEMEKDKEWTVISSDKDSVLLARNSK